MKSFFNVPSILELECAAEALQSSGDVLSMTLHTSQKTPIAYVNIGKGTCNAYDSFSSCVIVENDSKKTRLKTLIPSVAENESRDYGCTVAFETGGWTKSLSWSISVTRNSE